MTNVQQLRLLVLFFLISNQIIFAQCPKLTGVMIDACGASEGINEYFVLHSGAGITDITTLNIRYGTTNTFCQQALCLMQMFLIFGQQI